MADSYILHDVVRKVKADGLFDSIRRDLILDIEQKPEYVNLKTNIESSMSAYLAEHQWSTSLKKTDLRERARRHLETSDLIKDNLSKIVDQYMQTCQEQLIQPRLATFVNDHVEHIYQSIGATPLFRTPMNVVQAAPTVAAVSHIETTNIEKPSVSTPVATVKKESTITKPNVSSQSLSHEGSKPNPIKKKLPSKESVSMSKTPPVKKKPPGTPSSSTTSNPVKQEKKVRTLSPTEIDSVASPPPPIVRVASPLLKTAATVTQESPSTQDNIMDTTATVTPTRKKKRTKSENDSNPQKDALVEKLDTSAREKVETETRKLRSRRPNPKYSQEQFETGDLNISNEKSPTPPPSKPKKARTTKSSINTEQEKTEPIVNDTPTSPVMTSHAMSPEYGTVVTTTPIGTETTSVTMSTETITPTMNTDTTATTSNETNETQSTSPRRLRPRRGATERSSMLDNSIDKSTDNTTRSSTKLQEPSDGAHVTTRRATSTTTASSNTTNTNETVVNRSTSTPEQSITSSSIAEEALTTRSSSKSFIWKPKISK